MEQRKKANPSMLVTEMTQTIVLAIRRLRPILHVTVENMITLSVICLYSLYFWNNNIDLMVGLN